MFSRNFAQVENGSSRFTVSKRRSPDALQKHFVQNANDSYSVSRSFGSAARPRIALASTVCLALGKWGLELLDYTK